VQITYVLEKQDWHVDGKKKAPSFFTRTMILARFHDIVTGQQSKALSSPIILLVEGIDRCIIRQFINTVEKKWSHTYQ
jgi:hypothetical protein